MPINVFGNSSKNSDDKIDTSLFVQKPFLRTNYIESNIEDDIDLKNQYRIKKSPDPISKREAISKHYVDNLFNDPSIMKNTEHKDLNDRNIINVRFLRYKQWPQIDSHLTLKLYVDNAVGQSSLVRNNQDNDFKKNNLTNINSITLNTPAVHDDQNITKTYVDQFHEENERSRRDLGIDFYDESNDLVKNIQDKNFNDNKLTNIDSITVNRNPTSDNELSNKKYIDDELDKNTIVRFNQTLQNYLKVSVGSDTYNLTKYDKLQIVDTTEIRFPNEGKDLLQKRNNRYSDINGNGKLNNIIKSTKTSPPTSQSGATIKPLIGSSFMFIETSSGGHGIKVYVSFERTDIIQFTNITFYYKRFSILIIDNLKSMGRFRIQLFSKDNTWSTQNTISKNTQYSDNSTDWTFFKFRFYCKKLWN